MKTVTILNDRYHVTSLKQVSPTGEPMYRAFPYSNTNKKEIDFTINPDRQDLSETIKARNGDLSFCMFSQSESDPKQWELQSMEGWKSPMQQRAEEATDEWSSPFDQDASTRFREYVRITALQEICKTIDTFDQNCLDQIQKKSLTAWVSQLGEQARGEKTPTPATSLDELMARRSNLEKEDLENPLSPSEQLYQKLEQKSFEALVAKDALTNHPDSPVIEFQNFIGRAKSYLPTDMIDDSRTRWESLIKTQTKVQLDQLAGKDIYHEQTEPAARIKFESLARGMRQEMKTSGLLAAKEHFDKEATNARKNLETKSNFKFPNIDIKGLGETVLELKNKMAEYTTGGIKDAAELLNSAETLSPS